MLGVEALPALYPLMPINEETLMLRDFFVLNLYLEITSDFDYSR